MGFNTIAFILNDLMGERADSFSNGIKGSPKTVLDLVCFGYSADCERARQIAASNGETRLHPQALTVEQFHASETRYYRAGQNSLHQMKVAKYQTIKGKRYVLLELPDWAERYG